MKTSLRPSNATPIRIIIYDAVHAIAYHAPRAQLSAERGRGLRPRSGWHGRRRIGQPAVVEDDELTRLKLVPAGFAERIGRDDETLVGGFAFQADADAGVVE